MSVRVFEQKVGTEEHLSVWLGTKGRDPVVEGERLRQGWYDSLFLQIPGLIDELVAVVRGGCLLRTGCDC